jgi:hypothetical protein
VLYATIQIIKACADLQDFETAQMHSDNAANLLGRFPIFTAHLREAQSQVFGMLGAPQSVHALENAIESARIHGLPQYQEFLRSTLRQTKLASEST